MDFETVIYEHIMRHAFSFAVQLSISFPRLICGLLFHQHPDNLSGKDKPGLSPNLLDFNFSLYKINHVADLSFPETNPKEVFLEMRWC